MLFRRLLPLFGNIDLVLLEGVALVAGLYKHLCILQCLSNF